MIVGPF
jgi:hypothetical protein